MHFGQILGDNKHVLESLASMLLEQESVSAGTYAMIVGILCLFPHRVCICIPTGDQSFGCNQKLQKHLSMSVCAHLITPKTRICT